MQKLVKILLRIAVVLAVLIALAYVTGNGYLVRGVRYTYLIGRTSPEIDDRDFFPSDPIAATNAQPWTRHAAYGKVTLTPDQDAELQALHTAGFLVLQDGELLYEKYYDDWGPDVASNSFSVAKSYISVLTGIAMREGVITDVMTPVGNYLPEFAEGCHADITLYHLLTMSTGLDWSESGADPFSDNAKGYYGYNVRELSIDQPCRDQPGTEFDYISGSTQVMAEVLETAYGRNLLDLVQEKIWTPLGCEDTAWWGKDRRGGDYKAFCCLYATPRDFARIGQLYLDSGLWRGTRIVPEEYFLASVTPAPVQDKGKPNRRYGYFWWLAELDGKPIHYCRGFHGQYVVVIPHEGTVLVRTGTEREEVNEEGHPNDVFQWIATARALAAQAKGA
ncbi:MAG: serine hydrolase [Flavobacteriales bacterium]|nr:serine hydrolase [Flavobacteriales bacterium]HPQ59623.1 serine hydrolase [Flavobacteriales bacterium]